MNSATHFSRYDELSLAFRNGNEKAFEQIFKHYFKPICFYSYQITCNVLVAEDIVSEAFLIAWQKREKIREVKSYLFKVVKNRSLDYLRELKNLAGSRNRQSFTDIDTEKLAWESMIAAETLSQLQNGILRLPPKRQQVFKMLYQEGKSVREVAEELKVSKEVIREHKKLGLIVLKKLIFLIIFAVIKMS